MVGGNPAGSPCKDFGTAGGCKFGTCSFKH
jgi:hypothetical protein